MKIIIIVILIIIYIHHTYSQYCNPIMNITHSLKLSDYDISFNNLTDKLVCVLDYNGIKWVSDISQQDLRSGMINLTKLMSMIKLNSLQTQPNYSTNIELVENSRTSNTFLVLTVGYSNELIEFEEKIYFRQSNTTNDALQSRQNQIILEQGKRIELLEKKINDLESNQIYTVCDKNIIHTYNEETICWYNDNEHNYLGREHSYLFYNTKELIENNKIFNIPNIHSFFDFSPNNFITKNVDYVKIIFHGYNFDLGGDYIHFIWSFNISIPGILRTNYQNIPNLTCFKKNKVGMIGSVEKYDFDKVFDNYKSLIYFIKFLNVKKLIIQCEGNDFNASHTEMLMKFLQENIFVGEKRVEEVQIIKTNETTEETCNSVIVDFFDLFINFCDRICVPYNKRFNDEQIKKQCEMNNIEFNYI